MGNSYHQINGRIIPYFVHRYTSILPKIPYILQKLLAQTFCSAVPQKYVKASNKSSNLLQKILLPRIIAQCKNTLRQKFPAAMVSYVGLVVDVLLVALRDGMISA